MFALISCLIGEAGGRAYREGLWRTAPIVLMTPAEGRVIKCLWFVEIKGHSQSRSTEPSGPTARETPEG